MEMSSSSLFRKYFLWNLHWCWTPFCPWSEWKWPVVWDIKKIELVAELETEANKEKPKGNQFSIFIRRTDDEAPILWPLDAKGQLIRKGPDAGKDWHLEKGMTEDEMVGCHHWLNGHEFEQAPGDGEGQRSLMYCSSLGHKELDMTKWLNNNKEKAIQGDTAEKRTHKTPHPLRSYFQVNGNKRMSKIMYWMVRKAVQK